MGKVKSSKFQDHHTSVDNQMLENTKLTKLEEINDFIDGSLMLAVFIMSFMMYLYIGAYEIGPELGFSWASFGFFMCVFLITAAVAALMNKIFKVFLILAILILPFYIYSKTNPAPQKQTMGQIKSM